MKTFKGFFLLIFIAHFEQSHQNSIQNFDPCSSSSVTDADRIVTTLNGKIKGECYNVPITNSNDQTTDYSVFSWRGIPFAEPPTGINRFMKPVPVANWNDVKQTTEWPNACAQTGSPSNSLDQISEDCLYINIFAPKDTYSNRSSELKPVMVYIPGGAFSVDSSASDIFEPSTFVAYGDVIYASFNYRLGIFGFLHLNDSAATGNMGLFDQQLAMKWIYENAHLFGGDKTKITLFGESAGSWSVGFHLFIESSFTYFRNAIMESGTPGGMYNSFRLVDSNVATEKNLRQVSKICKQIRNSDKLMCLKSASLDELYRINDGFNIIVLDNILFKQTIFELINEKKQKPCKIIVGSNSAEAGAWLLQDPSQSFIYTKEEFKEKMNTLTFNEMIEKPTTDIVQSIYLEYFNKTDVPDSLNYTKLYIRVIGDQSFTCQTFSMAEAYSNNGMEAYVYIDDFIQDNAKFDYGGVIHGEELLQVFGQALSNKKPPLLNDDAFYGNYSRSFKDRNFSEKLITYWTNFAKYNDPNYSGSVKIEQWEPFVSKSTDMSKMTAIKKMKTGRYMLFGNSEIEMITGFSDHRCDFWNYTLDGVSSATSTLYNFLLMTAALIAALVIY